MSDTATAAASMDRIYRYQRHFYDATRRHYLLGRDTLLAGLLPPDGGTVVEVGCGTARNLIEAARAYPKASFYGFDISTVMLETAAKNIATAGLGDRIRLSRGDAADFDLQTMFGLTAVDRIFISYALSMIPPWRRTLDCASRQLAPGGAVQIVDFGQLQGWPMLARAALYAWLGRFAVHPDAALAAELHHLALARDLDLFVAHPYRGYATYATLQRRY